MQIDIKCVERSDKIGPHECEIRGSNEKRCALELLVFDEEVFGADLLDLLARRGLRRRLLLLLDVPLLRRVQERRRHAASVQVRLGLHRSLLRRSRLLVLVILLLRVAGAFLTALYACPVLSEPFPPLL